jgi:hypothetical protein
MSKKHWHATDDQENMTVPDGNRHLEPATSDDTGKYVLVTGVL